MPTKYLLLRTNVPVDESFAYSVPSSWSAPGGGPTALEIATLDGQESDEGSLRADPLNVAVMDAEVALALIEPKSQAPANVATLSQVGALKMPDGLVAVEAHRRRSLDRA